MRILGIETSCDETSVAVVDDGRNALSNLVSSSIDLHKKYGGIVPELACRRHLETINPLLEEAMESARAPWESIDAVAVTYGPGLVGALLIGVAAAKAVAAIRKIPLIGVNHLEGHFYANFLGAPGSGSENAGEPGFPFLALLVSGGHTNIVLVIDHGEYRVLGKTRDDAAGEAFDKVARALGLGYPGGPVVDKLAKEGDPGGVDFPRAMMTRDSLDFSFSGLKTAVVNYLQKSASLGVGIPTICASFQRAVIDVLVEKTFRAVSQTGVRTVAIAGGVSANSELRERIVARAREEKCAVLIPPAALCTDNGAVIASAGYYLYSRKGRVSSLDLDVYPNLAL